MDPSQRLMSWQAQIAMEQALQPRDRFFCPSGDSPADMCSNGSRPPNCYMVQEITKSQLHYQQVEHTIQLFSTAEEMGKGVDIRGT